VWIDAGPLAFLAIVQTEFDIRIPTAVPDPRTAIIGQPVDGVAISLWIVNDSKYRGFEFRGEGFICIQRENPVVFGF
jgi:hypothetical protein